MDTEQIQKKRMCNNKNEKINAATFTPNLGTVSCSGICLPSIKGLVHMFFSSLFYLIFCLCANVNPLQKERRWSRHSFICVLIL